MKFLLAKLRLLSEFPESPTYEQKMIATEALEVMYDVFFRKAARGETFGDLIRVKERFGNSIEENYDLSSGPFINFAKTYWTYKLELKDLFPTHNKLILSRILNEIEMTIASVFFPMPGPIKIPVKKRKEKQRELLQEFAPEIDIERFLDENPILKADQGREVKFILPEELKDYCYKQAYELAKIYEVTLSSRMEYERGFFYVMNALNVPHNEQEKMLSTIKYNAEFQGIPYHKLSPVNQYIMTVLPYILYCVEIHPPENITPNEINRLLHRAEFSHYIDKLAKDISQQVKGALWNPASGCFGGVVLILFISSIIPFGFFLLYKLLSAL